MTATEHRQGHGRSEGVCAGRRSTTWCSARCSSAAGALRSVAAERVGGRILEVGVGTGISLPDYSRRNRIVRRRHLRADAAQGARAGRPSSGCSNVEGLAVMDAEHLTFPDDSFDVVVAQYVVTTVPEPGGGARRVRPRAQARRRDRAGEPRRRRSRAAARRSSTGSRRRRASSAGARSFRGERYARWAARHAGHAPDRAPRRCRRSGISR